MNHELIIQQFTLAGVITNEALVAQLDSEELTRALYDVLRHAMGEHLTREHCMMVMRKAQTTGYPSCVILDMRGDARHPKTIAQFMPQWEGVADAYARSLHAVYGPHFALQVLTPTTKVNMMSPDPKRPGKFIQWDEQKIHPTKGN